MGVNISLGKQINKEGDVEIKLKAEIEETKTQMAKIKQKLIVKRQSHKSMASVLKNEIKVKHRTISAKRAEIVKA